MIKLRSLNLEPLRTDFESGHFKLVKRLSEDKGVSHFISSRFSEWIEPPISEDKYEIGKAYVITNKEQEEIGMCGSTKGNINSGGIVDLWVAIDEVQRGKGYGEKILVQMTEYFLDTIPKLDNISLAIKKENIASNKVAILSGYTFDETNDGTNYYQYFGKK